MVSSPNEGQVARSFDCLDLVGLPPDGATSGMLEIPIGLIDGPVALDHPHLAAENIRELPGKSPAGCGDAGQAACAYGTFVAGILLARRISAAPAICPGCSLLVRPIFLEAPANGEQMPSASAEELADAIVDVIQAGARVINLSVALQGPSPRGGRGLQEALDFALHRGVVVVAAAGNQSAVGSSAITGHPWVIPVIAYDLRGRSMHLSNLGASIGRCGLGAPGEAVTSLGVTGCDRGRPKVCGHASGSTAADHDRAPLLERMGKLRADVERAKLSQMLRGAAMQSENPTAKEEIQSKPYQVRLPGPVLDEAIGLGDVVQR
jgi:hypothetical protein